MSKLEQTGEAASEMSRKNGEQDSTALLPWILPDVDILIRGFTRRHPDLLVISAFQQIVAQRRLGLLGGVRQVLLERCQQVTQMRRFAQLLSAFPDLSLCAQDYVFAAEQRLMLRQHGITASSRQLSLWSVATRLGAHIWSQDKSWMPFIQYDCPVVNSPT